MKKALYTAQQCRQLDQIAIEEFGIPSYELMTRAAKAALTMLLSLWPQADNICVLCGSGNNGGDGLVLARLLKNLGKQVEVFLLVSSKKLQGDALKAYQDALQTGVKIHLETEALEQTIGLSTLVVDAMLGTGTQGELREPFSNVVDLVNKNARHVFALDLPTGLCADTGRVLGKAVKADATITFIANKSGLFTGEAREYCGELHCDHLMLDSAVFAKLTAHSFAVEFSDWYGLLKQRSGSAHKGKHGHVLLVGGDVGYGGAIALAGRAALRTGAGLVSVACHPDNAAMVTAYQPELMCRGIKKPEQIDELISQASVIALGPGLGQSAWSQSIFARVIDSKKLKVLDADALNFLAHNPQQSEWILTPHPGEAARLLQQQTVEVNSDRFAAASSIQQTFCSSQGVCVLKGAGTLVSTKDQTTVCNEGNPGMATGGSGDVLTGILASLLAQFPDVSLFELANLGVCLHSHAADEVARHIGQRGMLPSDVINVLHQFVNP